MSDDLQEMCRWAAEHIEQRTTREVAVLNDYTGVMETHSRAYCPDYVTDLTALARLRLKCYDYPMSILGWQANIGRYACRVWGVGFKEEAFAPTPEEAEFRAIVSAWKAVKG